ncbi:MAG: hypothetical protein COB45_04285 [Gammaproteobacteria bacterium]|nr:MAG: hypothetical protein COB45_04285 [Gammaproteobacteria bacterium]
MSSCVDLTNSIYQNNSSTLEQCTTYVVMTSTEYNNIQSEAFNLDAYDLGFEGVITMFVAGIGIGAVIGLITKIRR